MSTRKSHTGSHCKMQRGRPLQINVSANLPRWTNRTAWLFYAVTQIASEMRIKRSVGLKRRVFAGPPSSRIYKDNRGDLPAALREIHVWPPHTTVKLDVLLRPCGAETAFSSPQSGPSPVFSSHLVQVQHINL